MPRCRHETGLEIHHIDESPSNNEFENLIYLCGVHHSQVTKGSLDRKTVRAMKTLLGSDEDELRIGTILGSRRQLFEEACRLFSEPSLSARMHAVGPIFAHPRWWWDRRNLTVQMPSIDFDIRERLRGDESERHSDLRFIFTLSDRYRSKIEEFVAPDERTKFVEDVLAQIDLIWSEGNTGPDVCCIHTGFAHIDMVFETGVVTTFRSSPDQPLTSGLVQKSPVAIAEARDRFDSVFDSCSRGQLMELEKLRGYFTTLW